MRRSTRTPGIGTWLRLRGAAARVAGAQRGADAARSRRSRAEAQALEHGGFARRARHSRGAGLCARRTRRSCACLALIAQVPDFLDQTRDPGDSLASMRSRLHESFRARGRRRCSPRRAPTTPPPEFSLEVPRSAEHGDFACNAALLLAKPLRRPPRQVAERLIALLGVGEGAGRARRGGGPRLHQRLAARRRLAGSAAQRARARAPLRALAARRGQAHPDRVRLGESDGAAHARPRPPGRARRLASRACSRPSGYRVTREYYFNNGGRQMRVLGESVRARYLERLGRAAPPPEVRRRRGRRLARERSAACRCCSRATATRATTSARSPRDLVASRGPALAERIRRGRLPPGRRADRSSARSARRSTRSASASTSTRTRWRSTKRASSRRCSRTCASWTSSTRARARSGCARRRSGSRATAC